MTKPGSLGDLANLGPKSEQTLAAAGITSLEQLRLLGSVAAYVLAKRAGGNVSLNLLWALEGAISGMHWQEVARVHRTSLLLALEEHEKRASNPSIERTSPKRVRRFGAAAHSKR